MTALGGWLIAIGLCDLLRAARDTTSARRRLAVLAVGWAAFALVVASSPSSVGGCAVVFVIGALCLAGWVLGSAAALTDGARWGRWTASASLGAGLAGLLVIGGELDSPTWPDRLLEGPLAGYEPARVLLIVGVFLLQLSSANVVVRMLLDAVGVPAAEGERRLRGGRVLGPMERVFILGLGLAGALTAAAIVVAAKGLLRFPEIRGEVGVGDVSGPSAATEYFLIGSLASWLVPLAGLGLLSL